DRGSGSRRTLPGRSLDRPGPVSLHEPAVGVQLAVGAQVLDDVPVDRAAVRPAGERVRVADREMDGAVDLLVERDVLHVALNARVTADAELAQPARAVAGVKRLEQELLARIRRGLDDPAARELEADA